MRGASPVSLSAMAIVLLAQFTSLSQGLVDFVNSSATQIYTNAGAVHRGPTEPIAGNYYYGLFIAPSGASDPSSFSFTGIYATNLAAPGRLVGEPPPTAVPDWPVLTNKAFLVRGWSASLGHDWTVIQEQLSTQQWTAYGFYGESVISEAAAGGVVGTDTYPAIGIFGGISGLPSFDLYVVGNAPRLTIIPSARDVVLTWSTSMSGFTLQSTTNLSSPAWTTVSPGPVIVGGQNTVTNPAAGAQFYRLIQ